MADRELRSANGITFTADLDGSDPILIPSLTPADISLWASLGDDDLIFMVKDGTDPRLITKANFLTILGLPLVKSWVVPWEGTLVAIESGNALDVQKQIQGVDGHVNTLIGIKVIGVAGRFGVSGNSIVSASNDTWQNQGNPDVDKIQAACAWDAGYGDRVDGSIVLGSPPVIYLFPEFAAGHTGLTVQVDVKIT